MGQYVEKPRSQRRANTVPVLLSFVCIFRFESRVINASYFYARNNFMTS